MRRAALTIVSFSIQSARVLNTRGFTRTNDYSSTAIHIYQATCINTCLFYMPQRYVDACIYSRLLQRCSGRGRQAQGRCSASLPPRVGPRGIPSAKRGRKCLETIRHATTTFTPSVYVHAKALLTTGILPEGMGTGRRRTLSFAPLEPTSATIYTSTRVRYTAALFLARIPNDLTFVNSCERLYIVHSKSRQDLYVYM